MLLLPDPLPPRVLRTMHDATRRSPAHFAEGYSPKCLEGVFYEVRIAAVPLGDHPPNHRCYHDRRSGLANPQKSPQALLSDASTATIAITKASMMIMLPTITSQLPGTEMRLMAL